MSLVGRFDDLGLPDVFQMLSIGKKTGSLIIGGESGDAVIVFKGGLVVKAETNALEESFGSSLVRSGLIKKSFLIAAIEIQKSLPAKSIAEILVDLSAVDRGSMEKASQKRIAKIIARLLGRQGDYFRFEPNLTDAKIAGVQDLGWEVSTGLSPEYLLIEGSRLCDESALKGFNDSSDAGRMEESLPGKN